MAALGKVSAGLAHDLNNPTAAAVRAVQELSEVFDAVGALSVELAGMALSPEQWAFLSTVKRRTAADSEVLKPADPLRESEREDGFSDWLEDRGIPDGWRLAPTFAQTDLSVDGLETLAEGLPPEAGPAAISWLERSLAAGVLVREIKHATQRISELVNAVKSYSFMDRAPRQDLDVHQGLEDSLTLLGRKLEDHHIVVHREFDPDLPRIDAFGSELNQAWTNLLDNAIDAIRSEAGGGEGISGCARPASRTPSRWRLSTAARAFPKRFSRESSSRFLPRRTSAKAPASVFRSSTESSARRIKARSRLNPNPAKPGFGSACR
jgi:signal transduction histidine kinase